MGEAWMDVLPQDNCLGQFGNPQPSRNPSEALPFGTIKELGTCLRSLGEGFKLLPLYFAKPRYIASS